MECKQLATAEVCYNNGFGVPITLIAHYEYRDNALGNAVIHATRYTTPDGAPVDTTNGTVSAGACAVIPPDVEWETLCDVNATTGAVTEFFRRSITSFDGLGVPTVVVTDWELDKVTAYVPAGTVTKCNEDCDPVAPVGVVTTWG